MPTTGIHIYDPQIDEATDWFSQRSIVASRSVRAVGSTTRDLDDRDEKQGLGDIAAHIVAVPAGGGRCEWSTAIRRGRGNASEVADARPVPCHRRVVVNFNNGDFPTRCQAWFEYTAEHMDTWLPACGEMYGAGADIERYIDTMRRQANRFVPVFPAAAPGWAIEPTSRPTRRSCHQGSRSPARDQPRAPDDGSPPHAVLTCMRRQQLLPEPGPMNEGDIAANIDAISDALAGP